VIQVEVPPLRARGTDALLLAQHFVEMCAVRAKKQVVGMSETVAENCWRTRGQATSRVAKLIERAVALTRFDKLTVEDLPEKIRDYRSSQVVLGGNDPDELVPWRRWSIVNILHVLDAVGGNRTLAARTWA